MSSARQAPSPSRAHEPEPAHTLTLVTAQLRPQIALGIKPLDDRGIAHRAEGLAQPFAGHHLRPFESLRLRKRIAVVAAAHTGQQTHPFEKRDAVIAFLDLLPVGEDLVEPVAVDFDPFAFEQDEPFLGGHQLTALGGREPFTLQRQLNRKIQQTFQAREDCSVFRRSGH